MVMKAEPWAQALEAVAGPEDAPDAAHAVVPTPSGRPFTQAKAAELAEREHLVFACGRYEGIDRRLIDAAAETMPVEELSIGDYVLAGGEAAVLVIVEAVARLLPGVLGNAESARDDSFAAALSGLLEGPVYTKPAEWRGRAVPPVLVSGNHGAIARWRRDQAFARTAAQPPGSARGARPGDPGQEGPGRARRPRISGFAARRARLTFRRAASRVPAPATGGAGASGVRQPRHPEVSSRA